MTRVYEGIWENKMTYKTRQEVLRAAADWMDVCEAAGVRALGKHNGVTHDLAHMGFDCRPDGYEFPLALLEGKEVWVGSELWCTNSNHFFRVKGLINSGTGFEYDKPYAGRICTGVKGGCSWNQPKPATVMVELPLDTAEWYANNKYAEAYQPYFVSEACKKALENLK